MRRTLVVVTLLFVVAVVALVLAARSPWVQERLRARVLEAVSERLEADVRLEGARVGLLPLSLQLTGLSATSRRPARRL